MLNKKGQFLINWPFLFKVYNFFRIKLNINMVVSDCPLKIILLIYC